MPSVDPLVDREAQLFQLGHGAAPLELRHVDGGEQRLLGEQHRLLRRAADADPEDPRRAPAGSEPLDRADDPVGDVVRRFECCELDLVLGAAALGRDMDLDRLAGDQLDMEHRRRVVARVAPLEDRIRHDRGAQRIGLGTPGAAHRLVGDLLHGAVRLHPRAHADLHEDLRRAGVLAHRPLAERRHARVGEDLRHGVPRRRALLARMGRGEVLDIIRGMVMRDILQRAGDALDQILLADQGHERQASIAMTWRMTSPRSSRSKASLMPSSGPVEDKSLSTGRRPAMYMSI